MSVLAFFMGLISFGGWSCPSAAEALSLSARCAEMHGDYNLPFNGQVFPFSRRVYELKLTFLENAQGVSFYTNFDWFNLTQNLDTDTMVNSYRYEWSLKGVTINDCFNQPERCLESAAISLEYLTIAKMYPARPYTPENTHALYCAIERVRLFTKHVRAEIIAPPPALTPDL